MSEISHNGIVKEIQGSTAIVEILVSEACGACKASGICGTGNEQRLIEAKIDNNQEIKIGDEVEVRLNESLGLKAVILSYLLPFIVIVVAIFVLHGCGISEGISALVSLLLLIPYYAVLYMFRGRLKKEFSFSIERKITI